MDSAGFVRYLQVLDPQQGFTGLGRFFLNFQHHVPAHHQPGDVLLRHVRHIVDAHGHAPADDGNAVADFLDLVELVGDEDDRIAAFSQVLQLLEQLRRLLGGQDGGRLVQNQNLRAPEQRF